MTGSKTYFVRHSKSWDIADDVKKRLWSERKVAIRFEDVESVDPDDYEDAKSKSAICTFSKLALTGGYVCATYGPYDGCLVGKVAANSVVSFEQAALQDPSFKTALLKVLTLQSTIEVPSDVANRLLIGQPQQGTIYKWSAIRERVARFVEDGHISIRTVDDLLPYEQEVLCAEFLRTPAAEKHKLPRLAFLSAPVGRSRKAVDISGVTDSGLPVLAQVNYSHLTAPLMKDKASALKSAAPPDTAGLVLFCRTTERSENDGIVNFPIETVFEEMNRIPAWCSAISVRTKS